MTDAGRKRKVFNEQKVKQTVSTFDIHYYSH